ncbi:unnamed protein product [Arctia plantaginis]|uniref:Uncharacterized protein n=1 Tax=Arctia plantaginis TaxID=874455 RepID=A0A8S0YZK9_ARCPL|nr:unnamed protein product [Arctia plantaginis]
MGAIPGTFFWKPRLGLDLTIPKGEDSPVGAKPSLHNIREGKVVVFEGYQTGMTMLALSVAYSGGTDYYHLNPFSAHFYTNSYRWALRHLNLLPPWIAGNGGNYCETHKLWRRRFYYMDSFIPDWLRKVLFFVKKEDWEREEQDYKTFVKYAEPAFGRHNRYPSKVFNNFESQRKADSAENLEKSDSNHYKAK